MIVQRCALHLLCQQDQVRFEQELKHYNDLVFEHEETVRKHFDKQSGVDERIFFSTSDIKYQLYPNDQLETNDTKIQLGKSDRW